jgi:uncharacterized protein YndB with AHSA1/START domain
VTVTRVDKDLAARTLTVAADFEADPDRVWRLWADPRRLERWWGPPDHPATVHSHDLVPGGTVSFSFAGGEVPTVEWHVREVEAPRRLVFEFADPRVPVVTISVDIREREGDAGGTVMLVESTFETDADLESMLSIGFDRGLATSVGQADAAL